MVIINPGKYILACRNFMALFILASGATRDNDAWKFKWKYREKSLCI